MLEPTITQNSALYRTQHAVQRYYEAPQRRWFGRSLAKLPMVLRRKAGQQLEEVQRIRFGER
jgi:hypothetical protein